MKENNDNETPSIFLNGTKVNGKSSVDLLNNLLDGVLGICKEKHKELIDCESIDDEENDNQEAIFDVDDIVYLPIGEMHNGKNMVVKTKVLGLIYSGEKFDCYRFDIPKKGGIVAKGRGVFRTLKEALEYKE